MGDAKLLRSDFYVYVLFRHDTGEPFYVGKGNGKRFTATLRDICNRRKTGIIQKAKIVGRDIPRVKLASGLTHDHALRIEQDFIAAIGREPRGPLINLTDGGTGTSGHVVSEIVRAKLSDYTKRQMTVEAREYLREKGIAQFSSNVARAKLSHSCKITSNKPEVRQANKLRGIIRASDPNERERLRAESKKYNSREDVRKQRSDRLREFWKTDRDRLLAALKATKAAAWETRRKNKEALDSASE